MHAIKWLFGNNITDTTALELIKIVHCQSILPTKNVKHNMIINIRLEKLNFIQIYSWIDTSMRMASTKMPQARSMQWIF